MRLSSPLGLLLVVLGVAVLGLLALASARPGSTDDAFVLLVQARALLDGAGWEVQPGLGPVESVTSLLDLCLKALVLALVPGEGVSILWRTTGLVYLALLVSCAYTARKGRAGLIAVAALVLCPGLAEGSSYLLETPLYLGLILWASHAIPRSGGGLVKELEASLAATSLVLVRPEGAVVAGVLLLGRIRMGSGAPRWRPAAVAAGAWVLLCTWRLWIFGVWAPNSYFAKRSDLRMNEIADGANYVLGALSDAGRPGPWPGATAWLVVGPLLGVALAGPWLARRRPEGQAGVRTATLGLAASAALAVVVVSGGDGYHGLRLLAPVFFLATLCLVGWANSGTGAGSARALGLLAVVVGARVVEVLPEAPTKLRAVASAVVAEQPLDFEPQRRFAQQLERALAGEVVAHTHYQALKFFAPQLNVMDLTGITRPDIARLPAPGPVRFGREALMLAVDEDVGAIHLDPAVWRHEPVSQYKVASLAGEPGAWSELLGGTLPPRAWLDRLEQRYVCASLQGVAGPRTWVNLLVREDLAASFRAVGFQVWGP